MSARKVVGIDLGTTYSAMAHIDNYGKPQIIPNAETERITPSVIFFDGTNVIVGTVAKNNAVADPEKIVDFVKREMGKPNEQFHREFNGKDLFGRGTVGVDHPETQIRCREIPGTEGH